MFVTLCLCPQPNPPLFLASVTVLAALAGPSLLQLHISSACRVSEAALLEALPALQRMERIDMWGCSLAGTDFMVQLQSRVGADGRWQRGEGKWEMGSGNWEMGNGKSVSGIL